MGIRILFSISIFLMSQLANADLTVEQIRPDLENVIQKLDKINYLPNLLPTIISHRDFIGLTQKQVDVLDEWRITNKGPMVAALQKIVSKREAIKQASLSPTVSSSRLLQLQTEIFRLQREVIEYKLSCREKIIKTFNEGNWINFYMVLADKDIGITVPPGYADARRLQHAGDF